MDPILHPLLLLAVFAIPIRAFVVTHCNSPIHLNFRGLPKPPPLMDCFAISSHLPTLPYRITDYRNPSRDRSPDSPFFPQAMLHHGECLARVTYHSGLHPPGDQNPALSYLRQERDSTPEVALSEQSVFGMWATVREGMDSIRDECLVNDRTGVAWDYLDVPEISGAWLAVEILGTGSSGHWSNPAWIARDWNDQTRKQQMAALRTQEVHEETSSSSVPNKFKLSFLDVP